MRPWTKLHLGRCLLIPYQFLIDFATMRWRVSVPVSGTDFPDLNAQFTRFPFEHLAGKWLNCAVLARRFP